MKHDHDEHCPIPCPRVAGEYPEPEPLNPGHHCCASCWYWEIDTEYCHAAMGITDPAFHCQDWRGLKTRTDPMTGDPWPALNEAPLEKP